MDLAFSPLTDPTDEIAAAFTRWENDPGLIPLARPNQSQEDLDRREIVTRGDLVSRLEHDRVYLIYLDNELVGEMDYQVNPSHLLKREEGTAWIGIILGEATARGKGNGFQAIRYLEKQIKAQGHPRIELGVFAFNLPALKLYQRLRYSEIGRIEAFTFWQGKMWEDIRMEKRF